MKEKIIEAIEEAQRGEIKLVREEWGVEWSSEKKKWVIANPYGKRCCALGAVLLKYQPHPVGTGVESIDILGPASLTKHFDTGFDFNTFIAGFDSSHKCSRHNCNIEECNIGYEIAEMYNLHCDEDEIEIEDEYDKLKW